MLAHLNSLSERYHGHIALKVKKMNERSKLVPKVSKSFWDYDFRTGSVTTIQTPRPSAMTTITRIASGTIAMKTATGTNHYI
jgi:hypothetical protein